MSADDNNNSNKPRAAQGTTKFATFDNETCAKAFAMWAEGNFELANPTSGVAVANKAAIQADMVFGNVKAKSSVWLVDIDSQTTPTRELCMEGLHLCFEGAMDNNGLHSMHFKYAAEQFEGVMTLETIDETTVPTLDLARITEFYEKAATNDAIKSLSVFYNIGNRPSKMACGADDGADLSEIVSDLEQRIFKAEAAHAATVTALVEATNEADKKKRECDKVQKELNVEKDKARRETKRRKIIHRAAIRVLEIAKPDVLPEEPEVQAVLDAVAGAVEPALKEMGPI